MLVEGEFPAEFEIELVLEPADALENRFRLFGQVFFAVETSTQGHAHLRAPMYPRRGPESTFPAGAVSAGDVSAG